jgi:hypothetical protein
MHALIEKSTNAILRLTESTPPTLAPEKPFTWIACPAGTQISAKYDGTNFLPKPSQFHAWVNGAWVLDQAAQDAWDTSQAQRQADESARGEAKADNVVQYLVAHTPAEINTYVQTNVTDLVGARNLLAKLAVAVSVLARRELR